ncbi:MAG: hypothetical protein GY799_25220 [Desulfobulbaceae bacterium]|nr:hypothetical protein [Desulfobulbaceae bacterium]
MRDRILMPWYKASARRGLEGTITEKTKMTNENVKEGKAYQINGMWYANVPVIAPSNADMIVIGDDNESN